MKKTLAKILGITMVIILSMQNSFVFALKETEKLEQEQTLNNSKIKEYEKKQKELEKQKSAAMKDVEKLISEISDSEDEIEELEGQINTLKEQIESKEKDIVCNSCHCIEYICTLLSFSGPANVFIMQMRLSPSVQGNIHSCNWHASLSCACR